MNVSSLSGNLAIVLVLTLQEVWNDDKLVFCTQVSRNPTNLYYYGRGLSIVDRSKDAAYHRAYPSTMVVVTSWGVVHCSTSPYLLLVFHAHAMQGRGPGYLCRSTQMVFVLPGT